MSNTRPTLEERVIERWGNFENITGSSYVTFHVRAELEALKEKIKQRCVDNRWSFDEHWWSAEEVFQTIDKQLK